MTNLRTALGAPLKSRQQVVTDRLRDAILRGYFKPGQHIDQNEIAEMLNVSRSPIREALRTLAAEGLLELVPHHGAVVAELTPEELEEILVLRAVLEGMVARLAVPRLDDETIKVLGSLLKELSRAKDPDQWIQLNNRFHHTIYQLANRPRMLELIDNLRNTVMPYMREYIITSPDHIRESAESHRLIYEACVKRDPALVERETQKHLAAVSRGIVVYVKSQMIADGAGNFAPDQEPMLPLQPQPKPFLA